MDELISIIRVMPPPVGKSAGVSSESWRAIQDSLGLELPKDYRDFIDAYGTGRIDDFIWVLSPFAKNQYLNLCSQSKIILDAQKQFHSESGVKSAFTYFPDTNGLFPWGGTDNGDVLFWHCVGDPSRWNVVVRDSRSSRWRSFDLNMTAFLYAVVTKELIVDVFPDDFPSNSPAFTASGTV